MGKASAHAWPEHIRSIVLWGSVLAAAACGGGVRFGEGGSTSDSDGGSGDAGGQAIALHDGGEAGDGGAKGDAVATTDAASDEAEAAPAPCTLEAGSLPPRQTVEGVTASYPSLLLLDVNGDGRLDEVFAEATADDVHVRLGNGDGTFKPATVYPVGTQPAGIASADLNGDGHVDLVTANVGILDDATHKVDGVGVTVLLGRGDGTFGSRADHALDFVPDGGGSPRAVAVAIGDLTGDGIPDLAVATGGPDFDILVGAGAGMFSSAVRHDSGLANTASVAIGDLDSNGKADLVVSGTASGDGGAFDAVTVLLSTSSALGAPARYAVGGQGESSSVVIADLDGDGRSDLATTTLGGPGGGVGVLHGRGDGTFDPFTGYAGGGYAFTVHVGDLNHDGLPDLAVGNEYGVSVLTQTSGGGFQPIVVAQGVDYATIDFDWAGVKSLAIGDVDGDGTADIVAGDADYDLVILHNAGDGHLHPLEAMHHSVPLDVVPADLDGDGKIDLAVANYGTQDISVLLGNGDGTFQPEVAYPLDDDAGLPLVQRAYPSTVSVADLDRDGRPDLVFLSNLNDATQIASFLGADGGVFRRAATAVPGILGKPAIVDLNGDHIPDLAAPTSRFADGGTTPGLGYVGTSLGNGDGTFATRAVYQVAASVLVSAVVSGDFNADGRADVVAVTTGGPQDSIHEVNVFLGNGDGTLATPAVSDRFDPADAGTSASTADLSVAAGDLNGDGKLDLVIGEDFPADIILLFGKGDGSFDPPVRVPFETAFPGSYGLSSVALADLNADGKLDVAFLHEHAATEGRPMVGVMFGNGDGTFGPVLDRAAASGASALAVGAFWTGAPPGLVTANQDTNDLSVFPSAPVCP